MHDRRNQDFRRIAFMRGVDGQYVTVGLVVLVERRNGPVHAGWFENDGKVRLPRRIFAVQDRGNNCLVRIPVGKHQQCRPERRARDDLLHFAIVKSLHGPVDRTSVDAAQREEIDQSLAGAFFGFEIGTRSCQARSREGRFVCKLTHNEWPRPHNLIGIQAGVNWHNFETVELVLVGRSGCLRRRQRAHRLHEAFGWMGSARSRGNWRRQRRHRQHHGGDQRKQSPDADHGCFPMCGRARQRRRLSNWNSHVRSV